MKGALKSLVAILVATVVLFLLVEGAASVALATRPLLRPPTRVMAAERQHTEYDTLLGWVHRPGVDLPNLYGKGVGLRTNAQRLRADREYTTEIPPGKVRVVCSGDSFTLGHSVSNDDAWCAQLERLDPRLETVNMGQAAYGVDQAYLWYLRDGGRLRHDVQLFAFISSDFGRMRGDQFLGFPKPYLRLEHDTLVVKNTPVPRRRGGRTVGQRAQTAIAQLRAVSLLRGVASRVSDDEEEEGVAGAVLSEAEVRAVAAKLFEELKRANDERGSVLVLVFLPHPLDGSNRSADPWRELVRREAARLSIPYVDLVEEYRKIPALEGEDMFVRPFHPSHFNVRGNAWVARSLHDRIVQLPQIRARLGGGE